MLHHLFLFAIFLHLHWLLALCKVVDHEDKPLQRILDAAGCLQVALLASLANLTHLAVGLRVVKHSFQLLGGSNLLRHG